MSSGSFYRRKRQIAVTKPTLSVWVCICDLVCGVPDRPWDWLHLGRRQYLVIHLIWAGVCWKRLLFFQNLMAVPFPLASHILSQNNELYLHTTSFYIKSDTCNGGSFGYKCLHYCTVLSLNSKIANQHRRWYISSLNISAISCSFGWGKIYSWKSQKRNWAVHKRGKRTYTLFFL